MKNKPLILILHKIKRTIVDEVAWADSSFGEHVGANTDGNNFTENVQMHYIFVCRKTKAL
jgi:hypothetical protein